MLVLGEGMLHFKIMIQLLSTTTNLIASHTARAQRPSLPEQIGTSSPLSTLSKCSICSLNAVFVYSTSTQSSTSRFSFASHSYYFTKSHQVPKGSFRIQKFCKSLIRSERSLDSHLFQPRSLCGETAASETRKVLRFHLRI